MTYKTKGVCASHIEFEVDDNKKSTMSVSSADAAEIPKV